MIRVHRAVVAACIVLTVGGGVAVAEDAPTTSSEPRFGIAKELPALAHAEQSALASSDLQELRVGLPPSGSGDLGADGLTSVGGVMHDSMSARWSVFATENGGVCYLATRKAFDTPRDGTPIAGGCLDRLNDAGIQHVITIQRDVVRVFGVAESDVDRVEITTARGTTATTVRDNAFVWTSVDRDDVPIAITSVRGPERSSEEIVLDHLED